MAIERSGRAEDGNYYNMRGVNLKHLVDPIDDLFVAAKDIPGIATTGRWRNMQLSVHIQVQHSRGDFQCFKKFHRRVAFPTEERQALCWCTFLNNIWIKCKCKHEYYLIIPNHWLLSGANGHYQLHQLNTFVSVGAQHVALPDGYLFFHRR